MATRRPVVRPVNTPRPAVVNAPRPEVQQAAAERRPLPTFQQSQAISQQNRNREQAPQQESSLVDEEREIAQVLETPTRITRPQSAPARPQPAPARVQPAPQQEQQEEPAALGRPRPQLTPFNLEDEVARFSGNTRPEIARPPAPRPAARPIFDDNEEVFVERRPVAQPRPEPQQRPQLDLVQIPPATGQRSFATELVFDPRNNQFQTALQQRIPATNENLNFREQLIAFAPTTTTPRPFDEFAAPVRVARPQFEQPRQEARPQFEQPRQEARPQFEQPRQEARPQFLQEFEQFQQQQQQRPSDAFRQNIEDQERIRQDQERHRQQQEQQRLADERQRIAEENERRRITPAVQFVSQPQNVRFVADAQFQQQQQQQPQFFGPPQQQQPPRTIAEAERPSFASGQIDSFLSGLSG